MMTVGSEFRRGRINVLGSDVRLRSAKRWIVRPVGGFRLSRGWCSEWLVKADVPRAKRISLAEEMGE